MKSIALILKTTLYLLILSVIFSSNISAQKKFKSTKSKTFTNSKIGSNKNPITIEPLETTGNKISFHVGSPMFLRVKINGKLGCEPMNGQFFYFDQKDIQVGWGFEEVFDSTLFPKDKKSCERIIMLSSENSNRLPEGDYQLKLALYVNEKIKLTSDTITLSPIHANQASQESYSAFLLEQIFRNSPVLQDPETLKAIFSDKSLASAESEIYCGLMKLRAGDISGSILALKNSEILESKAGKPLGNFASSIKKIVSIKTVNN